MDKRAGGLFTTEKVYNFNHRLPKLKILGFFSFHFLYENVQCNVTHQDYAKRDSRLAIYGGVVLQRFELNL